MQKLQGKERGGTNRIKDIPFRLSIQQQPKSCYKLQRDSAYYTILERETNTYIHIYIYLQTLGVTNWAHIVFKDLSFTINLYTRLVQFIQFNLYISLYYLILESVVICMIIIEFVTNSDDYTAKDTVVIMFLCDDHYACFMIVFCCLFFFLLKFLKWLGLFESGEVCLFELRWLVLDSCLCMYKKCNNWLSS